MESNEEKEFSLLYAQAEVLLKTFPEYQFKTVASMFIVLGWLLTAETAQHFIRVHAGVTLPATIFAFTWLACLTFLWLKMHSDKILSSYNSLHALVEKNDMSVECIAIFNINKRLYLTYFMVNLLMSLAIIVTVYLICI